MIFLDYQQIDFNIVNGNGQTYTLPYKALVVAGNFQPDEENSIDVFIETFKTLDPNGDGARIRILFVPAAQNVKPISQSGCYVAEKDDVITINSADDCSVRLHFFRLPEE